MNKRKKARAYIRDEYVQDLVDTYWEWVIWIDEIEEPKKITTKSNNFVILIQMSETLSNNLLKKIWWWDKMWFAYFWYMQVLLNTLDYNNKVDFNIFESHNVSKPMVSVIKKKFRECWFVKKKWHDYYFNPEFAKKWNETPLFVIELFKS